MAKPVDPSHQLIPPTSTIFQTPQITPSSTIYQTPQITPSSTIYQTHQITPSATVHQTPQITPSATTHQTPQITPSATIHQTQASRPHPISTPQQIPLPTTPGPPLTFPSQISNQIPNYLPPFQQTHYYASPSQCQPAQAIDTKSISSTSKKNKTNKYIKGRPHENLRSSPYYIKTGYSSKTPKKTEKFSENDLGNMMPMDLSDLPATKTTPHPHSTISHQVSNCCYRSRKKSNSNF